MGVPINLISSLFKTPQNTNVSIGAGGGGNSGAGHILSDAEFQSRLKNFMPAWNTAYNTQRMQELEATGRKRGWEYQMLADQNRPGWNVPQGQVVMSAGDQHVNQLLQFADKGVIPDADLLATAKYYDEQWRQGGPVTKLPLITAGGDFSSGQQLASAPDNTEQFGPRGLTGAGGNNQGTGKTTTFDWNNGVKTNPNPGNPQFSQDADSAVARLRNINPAPQPPAGTPGGDDVAGVRPVNGQMESSLYTIPPAKMGKNTIYEPPTKPIGSGPEAPGGGPMTGVEGFLARSGAPEKNGLYSKNIPQQQLTYSPQQGFNSGFDNSFNNINRFFQNTASLLGRLLRF